MPKAKKEENKSEEFVPREEAGAMVLDCPQCGGQAKMTEHVEEVPHFGKVLISTLICDKCGFKLTDVMCVDFKEEPTAYSVEVKTAKDLETKVIKSSSGTIKIPKLGIAIEPGPMSDGYFSNIEGVLDRVETITKSVIASKDDEEANEKRLAKKELRRIQDARVPSLSYTVIIEDPFGNSALVGDKVKKIDLSEDEVKRLKKNIEVLEL